MCEWCINNWTPLLIRIDGPLCRDSRVRGEVLPDLGLVHGESRGGDVVGVPEAWVVVEQLEHRYVPANTSVKGCAYRKKKQQKSKDSPFNDGVS